MTTSSKSSAADEDLPDSRPDPKKVDRPSEKDAEKAQQLRQKAAELAAEASRLEGVPEEHIEVQAQVVRNVPDFEVVVLPGNVVSHQEKTYDEGDTVTVDGPTAMSLASLGHVQIKGVAE